MYWQVYLHKTTISADRILNNIIARVKFLSRNDSKLYVPESLNVFLEDEISIDKFRKEPQYLDYFTKLDDHDIWYSLKCWSDSNDPVLADLSTRLLNRQLFQISITSEESSEVIFQKLIRTIKSEFKISEDEAKYYVSAGSITNAAYMAEGKSIRILMKNGEVLDIAKAADLPNIKAMSKIVRKFYLCWPKGISL
jgi:hypothetical protein